jgi:hypothetical protein
MNQIPEWSYVLVGESLYQGDGVEFDCEEVECGKQKTEVIEEVVVREATEVIDEEVDEVIIENDYRLNLSKIIRELLRLLSDEFNNIEYLTDIFI